MLKWEQMEREALKLQVLLFFFFAIVRSSIHTFYFKASVARMAATRQPGGEIKTGSISFPIPELTKVIFKTLETNC